MREKRERLVRLWLDKAEKDLKSAEREMEFDQPITETVCFHSQQSAEKYLKAFLVKAGKVPPRIHDIGALVKICSEIEISFDKIKDEAIKLSIYAVEIRYPDDFYEPSSEEAKETIKVAYKVKKFVLNVIKKQI